jgi:hypothetical protein
MEGTGYGMEPGFEGGDAPVNAVDFGRGPNDLLAMLPRAVGNGSAGPLGSRPGGFFISGKALWQSG